MLCIVHGFILIREKYNDFTEVVKDLPFSLARGIGLAMGFPNWVEPGLKKRLKTQSRSCVG
jgi:hypothetical protein